MKVFNLSLRVIGLQEKVKKNFYLGFLFIIYLCNVSCDSIHDKPSSKAEEPVVRETYISELNKIAKDDDVKAAFQSISNLNNVTRENHVLLNEIPAPPFKEEQRARQFFAMIEQAGADSVWMDSIGNVLALRKGLGPHGTVVIDGHLDTVFPEGTDVKVKHKGDTLYAPGISDNARALAMMLTLMKVLSLHEIRTTSDVLFLASVGEEGEGDLRGVKHFLNNSRPITSFISIDIGNMGIITNQAVGSLRYKITFMGPGGHSLGDFGIVSPHFAMANALSEWDRQAADYIKGVREKTTYNVGVTGGGTSVNSISFESWATIDIRSEKVQHLQHLDMLMQTAIQQSLKSSNANKAKGTDLTVQIEKIGDRPAGLTEVESALVQRAMAATKHFGKSYELKASSTNSNLPMSLGIPAITVGQGGRSGSIHSLDEWWLDQEGDLAIQSLLLLLLAESEYGSYSQQ